MFSGGLETWSVCEPSSPEAGVRSRSDNPLMSANAMRLPRPRAPAIKVLRESRRGFGGAARMAVIVAVVGPASSFALDWEAVMSVSHGVLNAAHQPYLGLSARSPGARRLSEARRCRRGGRSRSGRQKPDN